MDIYLEGGNHLRNPMKGFLRRAVNSDNPQSVELDVVPCQSRDRALSRFGKAQPGSLLLIDSEGEDIATLSSRVSERTRLADAAERAFFMVQFMESWFLADRNTLTEYFGAGFRANALPRNPNIEDISKQDVEHGLRDATRNCAKRRYLKVRDDARLLGLLNPTAVYDACPNFADLIDFLRGDAASR